MYKMKFSSPIKVLFVSISVKFAPLICGLLWVQSAQALELKVESARLTLSRPETSHSLSYKPLDSNAPKIHYDLTPINNERLGLFIIVNGIEIGYATDISADDKETKTENLIFSYRELKHTRLNLTYQVLEGFETKASDSEQLFSETRFLSKSKSTKIELSGLHNLYTVKGESLFNHFFLNKPQLSDRYAGGISFVGGWSYKNLSLEGSDSLLFDPSFSDQAPGTVSEVDGQSYNVSIGPLLSISLPRNIHLFYEYKYGRGYFKNSESAEGRVKRSGNEKIRAQGGGISWTSSDKEWLLLLRAWEKNTRHVETTFGDLSLIRFF